MLARKFGLALLLPAAVIALVGTGWLVWPGGLVGTGWAQQPTQAQIGAIRQSCRTDYQSFCPNVQTGGGAVITCLQQHAASLSPACGQALGGMGAGGGAAALAGPPAAVPPTYAPSTPYAPPSNVTPPAYGGGGFGQQPATGGFGQQGGGNQQAMIAAFRSECGQDFRRLCRSVQPGGGRVIGCLEAHRDELSPGCQQLMSGMGGARQ